MSRPLRLKITGGSTDPVPSGTLRSQAPEDSDSKPAMDPEGFSQWSDTASPVIVPAPEPAVVSEEMATGEGSDSTEQNPIVQINAAPDRGPIYDDVASQAPEPDQENGEGKIFAAGLEPTLGQTCDTRKACAQRDFAWSWSLAVGAGLSQANANDIALALAREGINASVTNLRLLQPVLTFKLSRPVYGALGINVGLKYLGDYSASISMNPVQEDAAEAIVGSVLPLGGAGLESAFYVEHKWRSVGLGFELGGYMGVDRYIKANINGKSILAKGPQFSAYSAVEVSTQFAREAEVAITLGYLRLNEPLFVPSLQLRRSF